jgi:hypothetical protein
MNLAASRERERASSRIIDRSLGTTQLANKRALMTPRIDNERKKTKRRGN